MIHEQVNLGLEINSLNFEVAQGLKLFFFCVNHRCDKAHKHRYGLFSGPKNS